jgi:hypothetical protein
MPKPIVIAVYCAAFAACSANARGAASARSDACGRLQPMAAGAGTPGTATTAAVDGPSMPMVLQPVMVPSSMTGRDADGAAAAKLVYVLDQNGAPLTLL